MSAGHGWARTGLVFGIVASLAGNVRDTMLSATATDPVGAVVGAVFWPAALFVAIEIMIKTAWCDGWRDNLARVAGVGSVAAVTGYVSYGHLCQLLTSWGYDTVASHIGPLGVDGLMVVATVALTRRGLSPVVATPVAPQVTAVVADVVPDEIPSWMDGLADRHGPVSLASDVPAAPVATRRRAATSPATAPATAAAPSWKQDATRLLEQGRAVADVATALFGEATPTARRRVQRVRADMSQTLAEIEATFNERPNAV